MKTETTKSLYACAYRFYENGKYEEAIHFFRLLTVADVNNDKYWVGLAASYKMNKETEKALEAYAIAAILDENDPFTHLYAAECLFDLGRTEEAIQALDSAERVAKKNKNQQLLSHLEIIREVRYLNQE